MPSDTTRSTATTTTTTTTTTSLTPSSGEIVFSPARLRVAMLRQEFEQELDLNATLMDNMFSVFGFETGILARLDSLEKELEQGIGDERR